MSGDSPRSLSPPEPGQEIPGSFKTVQKGSGYVGLYGLLWKRARYYDPYTAKCQRCGWEWEIRNRHIPRVATMPLRCANRKCSSRRWSQPPYNDQVLRYAPHLAGDNTSNHQEVSEI